ncbi:MAG: UDP-N-acetylmuramoyl-L-alanine--D-glutamate ligase [Alphaproteobacteria bacterium]|nr:UDP-N-acetylmuramoyl-L-alanine--D-glutamate ligase [Alphaproteobacteria bacterium]
MIPVRGYEGHKVAVLGLGRSGLSAARALKAGGATALCWDDSVEARAGAEAEGLSLHDLTRAKAWDGVVSLIVSPGIAHLYPAPHPIIKAAWQHGVAVDNDIGLFFRSYATQDWDNFEVMPRVVAVTGSNGKSTTSALIHHILTDQGRPAELAGNIGRGVLDIDPGVDGGVVVLELSSYQIELARALAPDIGVFLNLSPDHLDRHGGIGGYFAAKRRLFVEGGPDRAIIGVDEDEGWYLANQLRENASDGAPVIAISANQKLLGDDWTVTARKGYLSERRRGRQVSSIDLRAIKGLPGAHNHQNACAAYAVCRTLGLAPRLVEKSLNSFPGLPHRSQILAVKDGVTFVNDSKATNVESAAQALQAFKRIRWIAGGQGKDGGIAALSDHLGSVAKAYLIGYSAEEFARQLGETPYEICETLEIAVAKAATEAEEGDTVLLAPAAASFDQYPDFEKRGEAFAALVQEQLDAPH